MTDANSTPPAPQSTHTPPATPIPWWIPALIGTGLLALTLWAWPPRNAPQPDVVRGNAHYVRREFAEALDAYQSAPGAGPRNAGVQLDRGLARFRVTVPPPDAAYLPLMPPDAAVPPELLAAQEEMRTAARGGTTGAAEDVDAFLRARAAYDLGNTFFTARQWDNAIDAFKESLRLRPAFRDAAWNLELARRLKELDRNPPDAAQDASQDASEDASQDSGPPDAGDGGNDGGDGGSDGGNDGGMDGGGDGGRDGGADGGSDGGGDGGNDGASPGNDGGGQDAASPNTPDAGAPPRDASAPRTLSPLDDLDRGARSLQNEMLRRRGLQPVGPDDDR